MSAITTHVLDTGCGRPAQGIEVALSRRDADAWQGLGASKTDADGRASDLLAECHELEAGIYRLRFEVGAYFARQTKQSFYPHVDLVFEVADASQHFHVPLLLGAFGFTTYRGS